MLAAVSGGADSVALLLVLRDLARQEGFFLSSLHVNHGLRASAPLDAEFVLDLCQTNRIPCSVVAIHVQSPGENGAREGRYQALLEACASQDIKALALAHHQRDQAETVLLHLLRGSGGDGLAGMAERAQRLRPDGKPLLFWRPFLDISPDAIRQALLDQGAAWREDETNADDGFLRNYVRHTVLSPLRDRLPAAEEALSRTARILQDEAAYFHQEADRFLSRHACPDGPCRWVDAAAFQQMPPALQRHILRRFSPVSLSFDQLQSALQLRPGETANWPEGWRLSCSSRYLHLLSPCPEPPEPGALTVEPFRGTTGDGIRMQALPRKLFAACVLRYRVPGDIIQPLGAAGRKKLQDYWVDRHIERPFRDYLPLLCAGDRVIWSIGVGVSEEARVSPGDDAVLLAYHGFLPGEKPGLESIQKIKGDCAHE